MLRRMKPFVPKHIMITVYKSLELILITAVWFGTIAVLIFLIKFKKCKIERQE